jgi:hypothetical protein
MCVVSETYVYLYYDSALFLKRDLWIRITVQSVDITWDSFRTSFSTCDFRGYFGNLKLSSYHGKAAVTHDCL